MTAIARNLLATADALRPSELIVRDLYTAHARYIARVVHRILGTRSTTNDVDDIVQETFLAALKGISDLEDPEAAKAWLIAVAVRHTRRWLGRQRRRELFAFWAKDYGPKASDPRDREPVDELYHALHRVPPDLRVAWVLHRIEQMSHQEVASACEVSVATVKRRITDADYLLGRQVESSSEPAPLSTPNHAHSSGKFAAQESKP